MDWGTGGLETKIKDEEKEAFLRTSSKDGTLVRFVRRRRRLRKKYSPEKLVEARDLAWENCDALLIEAKLLYDNERYARAMALWILAEEEAAKAWLCDAAEIGIVRLEDLDAAFTTHKEKVWVGMIWIVMSGIMATFAEFVPQIVGLMQVRRERGGRGYKSEYERLVKAWARRLEDELEGRTGEAPREQYRRLLDPGSLVDQKERGLYVDIERHRVTSPEEIAKEEVDAVARATHAQVEELRRLKNLWSESTNELDRYNELADDKELRGIIRSMVEDVRNRIWK